MLVADDSAVNLEVAQAGLRRLGVEPRLVDCGTAAVEAFRIEQYDLILMDGSMPDIDGFEATKMIRAIEQAENRRRVPIIALTAHVVARRPTPGAQPVWTTFSTNPIAAPVTPRRLFKTL